MAFWKTYQCSDIDRYTDLHVRLENSIRVGFYSAYSNPVNPKFTVCPQYSGKLRDGDLQGISSTRKINNNQAHNIDTC